MNPTTQSSSAHAERNLSIHGPALTGWQFHQSHAQVTVVFYISLDASDEEVEVSIASDHVVAGMRGYEPVLKASLYARVDPQASSWQVERRPDSHHHHRRLYRRRSRRAKDVAARAHSIYGSAEVEDGQIQPGCPSHTSSTSSLSSISSQSRQQTVRQVEDAESAAQTQSFSSCASITHRSRPHSPAQSSDSYELLQFSSLSLDSRRSYPRSQRGASAASSPLGVYYERLQDIEGWSDVAASSPRSQIPSLPSEGAISSTSPQSPRSLSSRNSPPCSDVEDSSGMQSSNYFSTTSSSGSQPSSSSQADGALTARLVTVHLTKIDVGMWPSLISGPIPIYDGIESTFHGSTNKSAETSLAGSASGVAIRRRPRRNTDATSDASLSFEGSMSNSPGSSLSSVTNDDVYFVSSWRTSHFPATESTTSFQSDDSTTVLGMRRPSIDENASEEAKFNMDPISLILVGLQIKANLVQSSSSLASWDEAFMYFARSWRKCDLPVATKILVKEYLPLIPRSHQQHLWNNLGRISRTINHSASACRPQMVAGLGGTTALARLYVSYAKLHLSSSGSLNMNACRAYLFPWGSGHCRDPYSVGAFGFHSVKGATSRCRLSSPTRWAYSPYSSPRSVGLDLSSCKNFVSEPKLSNAQRTLYYDGPLLYLEEARRLDVAVHIEASDWAEAHRVANMAALEVDAEMAADDGDHLFGDDASEQGGSGSGSVFPRHRFSRCDAKIRSKKVDAGKRRSTGKRVSPSSAATADDDGLLTVLSGAALVSFVVAGSVAMFGWWKKAPGATAT